MGYRRIVALAVRSRQPDIATRAALKPATEHTTTVALAPAAGLGDRGADLGARSIGLGDHVQWRWHSWWSASHPGGRWPRALI